jgi:hypothetical protein
VRGRPGLVVRAAISREAPALLGSFAADGVNAVLDLVNGKDAVRRDADIIKSGGAFISTLYAADALWLAERHITAYNISSGATTDSAAAHTNPNIARRAKRDSAYARRRYDHGAHRLQSRIGRRWGVARDTP